MGSASIIQIFMQILIFSILARILSPEEFGRVATANIVIDLILSVATLGTAQAIVQKTTLTSAHISAAFWISLSSGLVITLIIISASSPIARFLGDESIAPMIKVLSLTFIIKSIASVSEGLIVRSKDFRILAVRQIISYFIGYGLVGLLLAYNGAKEWSLVYAQVTQVSITTCLFIFKSRFHIFPIPGLTHIKDIFKYGSGLSAARVVNSFANQVDRGIIASNSTFSTIGIYTRAFQLSRYPSAIFGQVIEDVLFPTFATMQGEPNQLCKAYLKSLNAIFIILAPISVFFIAVSDRFVELLLGSQWNSVIPIFSIFVISLSLRSAQRISSALLRAIGRPWLNTLAQCVLLISTVLGSYIGIQWGVVWAAVGVTVAFAFHYVFISACCMICLNIRKSEIISAHLSAFKITLITFILTQCCTSIVNYFGFPAPFIVICISTFLSVLTAVILFPKLLGPNGSWLITMILGRVPKKIINNKVFSIILRRILK